MEVSTSPGATALSLVGGRVVEGDSARPRTVVIADGRIVDLLDPGAAADAPHLDVGGLTLVPGVVDAHVHLAFADPADVLAGGVTTVRDLGGPPSARRAGVAAGLRVLAAGRVLTAVGGYPAESWAARGPGAGAAREVRDVDDAAAAVAELLAAAADVVKVALESSGGRPLLAPDVLAAVVGAARAAGLPVTAHVGGAAALDRALEAGVDELAHLPLHRVSPSEMGAVAAAGVVVVPTLAVHPHPELAQPAFAAFLAAGGTAVWGTDLGNGGTAPGVPAAEVRAWLAAGVSPAGVLHAATAGAADHLGLGAVGRLERGAVADVVGLDGDPLEDPTAWSRVCLVVAAGEVAHAADP